MFSRISLAAGAIAGGFVVLIVTQAVNALWTIPAAREEGGGLSGPNSKLPPPKQSENSPMKLIRLGLIVASALSAAGCISTQAVNASKDRLNQAARAVVGTSLVGARGATPADQDKIDETIAGLCGARAWTQSECARHDAAQQ